MRKLAMLTILPGVTLWMSGCSSTTEPHGVALTAEVQRLTVEAAWSERTSSANDTGSSHHAGSANDAGSANGVGSSEIVRALVHVHNTGSDAVLVFHRGCRPDVQLFFIGPWPARTHQASSHQETGGGFCTLLALRQFRLEPGEIRTFRQDVPVSALVARGFPGGHFRVTARLGFGPVEWWTAGILAGTVELTPP